MFSLPFTENFNSCFLNVYMMLLIYLHYVDRNVKCSSNNINCSLSLHYVISLSISKSGLPYFDESIVCSMNFSINCISYPMIQMDKLK